MDQRVVDSVQASQTLLKHVSEEEVNNCLVIPPSTSLPNSDLYSRINTKQSTTLLRRQSCSDVVVKTCNKTDQVLANGSRKTVSFVCPSMHADQRRPSLERACSSKYRAGLDKWLQPRRIRRKLPDVPNNSVVLSLNKDVIASTDVFTNLCQDKEKTNVQYLKTDMICCERLCCDQRETSQGVSIVTDSDTTNQFTEVDTDWCKESESNHDVIEMRYNCRSGTMEPTVRVRTVNEDICFTPDTSSHVHSCKTQLAQVRSEINCFKIDKENSNLSGGNCSGGLPSSAEHLRLKINSVNGGENNSYNGSKNSVVNGSRNNSVNVSENSVMNVNENDAVTGKGHSIVIESRNNAVTVSENNSMNQSVNISVSCNGHDSVVNASGNNTVARKVNNLDCRPSLSTLLTYTHLLCVILESPVTTTDVTFRLSAVNEGCTNYYNFRKCNNTDLNKNEKVECAKYEKNGYDKIDPALITRCYDTRHCFQNCCETSEHGITLPRSNTSAFSLVKKPKSCLCVSSEDLRSDVHRKVFGSLLLVTVTSLGDSFKMACGGEIQEGDYIIEINGHNVTDSDVDDVIERLTGSSAPLSVVIGRPRHNMTSLPDPPLSRDHITTSRSSDDWLTRHYDNLLQQRDEELSKKDDVIKQLNHVINDAARGKCLCDVTIPRHECESSDCCCDVFIKQDDRGTGAFRAQDIRTGHNNQVLASCGSNNEEIGGQHSFVPPTNDQKYCNGSLPHELSNGQVLRRNRSDNQVIPGRNRRRLEKELIRLSTRLDQQKLCPQVGQDHSDHRSEHNERVRNEHDHINDKYHLHGLDNTKEDLLNELIHRNNLQPHGLHHNVENRFVSLTNLRDYSEKPNTKLEYSPMSKRQSTVCKDVDRRGWYESNSGSGVDSVVTMYDPEHGWQKVSAV